MRDGQTPAATLHDVARAAGVHPSTVSRALDPSRQHLLSPETRQRVAGVAEALGYQVNTLARSLRTGTTGVVGVVVPTVTNPYVGPFLRGAEEVLESSGRILLIAESHDDRETMSRVLQQMVTRRLDAVIVLAARRGDEVDLARTAAMMPVVLAVRGLESGGLPTIAHDDRRGARLATEHLLELGHRRLAQVPGQAEISSFRDRSAGFRACVAEHLALDVSGPEVATEPAVEQGRLLGGRLLDREPGDRPTAVFAHNDLLAVGVLTAVAERGLRCPEDVSVVGYNDSPLTAHLAPPLTTVRLPTTEIGARAGRLVTALLGGVEAEAVDGLEPTLVVRGSSSAPGRPAGPRR